MKLFNGLTKIKKGEKSMKIKKKKGFTLIELIAVIAILAILGAIIVPKIIGYTTKADTAKIQADAKIVLNAVGAYDATNGTTTTAVVASSATPGAGEVRASALDTTTVPAHCITTIVRLQTMASGTGFTYTKSSGVYTVTIP